MLKFLKGGFISSCAFLLFLGITPAEFSFGMFMCDISEDKYPNVIMVLVRIGVSSRQPLNDTHRWQFQSKPKHLPLGTCG